MTHLLLSIKTAKRWKVGLRWRMEQRPGLQTAEAVGKALRRKQKAEMKAMKDAGLDPEGKAHETVYRDASGRRIDVAMKRAELRAKAEEDERKRLAADEAARGDVQKGGERGKEAEVGGGESYGRLPLR